MDLYASLWVIFLIDMGGSALVGSAVLGQVILECKRKQMEEAEGQAHKQLFSVASVKSLSLSYQPALK